MVGGSSFFCGCVGCSLMLETDFLDDVPFCEGLLSIVFFCSICIFLLNSLTISMTVAKLASGSHVDSLIDHPTHLTRY